MPSQVVRSWTHVHFERLAAYHLPVNRARFLTTSRHCLAIPIFRTVATIFTRGTSRTRFPERVPSKLVRNWNHVHFEPLAAYHLPVGRAGLWTTSRHALAIPILRPITAGIA